MPPRRPSSTLFPYTTLFRSGRERCRHLREDESVVGLVGLGELRVLVPVGGEVEAAAVDQDRKSTRLNSSHVAISYAVFCLKKKKDKTEMDEERITRLRRGLL